MSDDLRELRRRIEELDERTIELFAERFRLVRDLGRLKARSGLPVEDGEREAALQRQHDAVARREGLDPELVRAVFAAVIDGSKRLQRGEGANGSPGGAPEAGDRRASGASGDPGPQGR